MLLVMSSQSEIYLTGSGQDALQDPSISGYHHDPEVGERGCGGRGGGSTGNLKFTGSADGSTNYSTSSSSSERPERRMGVGWGWGARRGIKESNNNKKTQTVVTNSPSQTV